MDHESPDPPKPSLPMAVLPIALTLALLMIQLFVFDDFTPQIPLALGILITGGFARAWGWRWSDMEVDIYHVAGVGLLWAATGWFVPRADAEERERWRLLEEPVMRDGRLVTYDPDDTDAALAEKPA